MTGPAGAYSLQHPWRCLLCWHFLLLRLHCLLPLQEHCQLVLAYPLGPQYLLEEFLLKPVEGHFLLQVEWGHLSPALCQTEHPWRLWPGLPVLLAEQERPP